VVGINLIQIMWHALYYFDLAQLHLIQLSTGLHQEVTTSLKYYRFAFIRFSLNREAGVGGVRRAFNPVTVV
jgi:hypothetical protein